MCPAPDEAPESLRTLRRAIEHLATACRLDLGNRPAIRRFLDNDPASLQHRYADPKACQELRRMLILLYRLEACSSEDLGYSGLDRLWHQHDEIVRRFRGDAAA